jgi:hypothetical protein
VRIFSVQRQVRNPFFASSTLLTLRPTSAIREPPLSESFERLSSVTRISRGMGGAVIAFFAVKRMYLWPDVDRFLCDVAVFGFTFIRAYRQPIKIPGSIISFMVRDGEYRHLSLQYTFNSGGT